MRIPLEQPIQFSAPGRHGVFAFQTKFAHLLATGALSRTNFLVRANMSALSHGFTTFAGAGCGLPLVMKTVKDLGGCDLWW